VSVIVIDWLPRFEGSFINGWPGLEASPLTALYPS
jgi:hypothetical protein